MKMAKNNKRKEVYEVDEGDHQTVEEKKLWWQMGKEYLVPR
jgi:hypothetical protein